MQEMTMLKLNQTYICKKIANQGFVVPASGTQDASQMMGLNESGYLLWTALEKGADRNALLQLLLREYDVSPADAFADIEEFLDRLKRIGALEV